MNLHTTNIKEINNNQIDDLITILNTDKELQKELGNNKRTTSRPEFIKFNKEWTEKNNAEIFAITLNDEAIGLISLSKISKEAGTANIGYWIASKYWNKGYTTKAFEQVLNFAKKGNIKTVSCSIDNENTKSVSIWKKFNADFKNEGDKIVPLLHL